MTTAHHVTDEVLAGIASKHRNPLVRSIAMELAERRAGYVYMTGAWPICDACGWKGDFLPTIQECNAMVRTHLRTCAEARKIVLGEGGGA